jgi:lysophospholipase L1-like esterase
MIKAIFTVFIHVFFIGQTIFAQSFDQNISSFLKNDSLAPPEKNGVLLIGSSSFTMWNDAQSYFPNHKIINRGFGGSTLLDQIAVVKKIVDPYQAASIFIYCGENDLAYVDTVTADIVFQRYVTLYQHIRKRNSEANIYYISIKPSPSRWHLQAKVIKANKLIKDFMSINKRDHYINVYDAMLTRDGQANTSLFIEDMLHMNAEGYKIWADMMKKALSKK